MVDTTPEDRFAVFVAEPREFLSKKHSEHRTLDDAKIERRKLWLSGTYGRISIYRGSTWLVSWVETTNASEVV